MITYGCFGTLPSLVVVTGDESLVHLDVVILQGVYGASFAADKLLESLLKLRLQSNECLIIHRQPRPSVLKEKGQNTVSC